MPTDPTVAWLIALVVCTVYGWYMHVRGAETGRNEAVVVICDALEFKKGMKHHELLEIVSEYQEAVEAAEEDDA